MPNNLHYMYIYYAQKYVIETNNNVFMRQIKHDEKYKANPDNLWHDDYLRVVDRMFCFYLYFITISFIASKYTSPLNMFFIITFSMGILFVYILYLFIKEIYLAHRLKGY